MPQEKTPYLGSKMSYFCIFEMEFEKTMVIFTNQNFLWNVKKLLQYLKFEEFEETQSLMLKERTNNLEPEPIY